MELIVISESKIKLMLTSDEMAAYPADTRAMLRGIMHDAREKCGCAPMDGRVFVQMYPSKKGGCELFVTRLDGIQALMRGAEERTITDLRQAVFRERHIIYSFETMQYLLDCCFGLWRMGYAGASVAYLDPGSRTYYLMLDGETHVAGENFGVLCPSQIYYYIREHCDVVCPEEAVSKLGPLA